MVLSSKGENEKSVILAGKFGHHKEGEKHLMVWVTGGGGGPRSFTELSTSEHHSFFWVRGEWGKGTSSKRRKLGLCIAN